MGAEYSKADKQLLAEKIWLLYLNDVLYRDGIITKEDYHKMLHRINSRKRTMEQTKGG